MTQNGVECLKRSAKFPSPEMAQSAIRKWSDPAQQAFTKILKGQIPSVHTAERPQPKQSKGLLASLFGAFRNRPSAQKCETCSHEMEVLEFSGRGAVMLSPEDVVSGVGQAEQCWECGRLYCAECYPSRPPNTCVCGQGRTAVRHVGGATYRGSLRLVKVRYVK